MPSTHMDRETFLAHLHQSGLLTPEQWAEVREQLPDTHRGRIVARALVQAGLLTKFQAEMLLAGRTSGFQLGQYRILDQLGRGGMGRVFKALHLTMNRVVALKLVSTQVLKSGSAPHVFQREVRAAARLTHPNIVTAYDANQIGDRYYLVMEFVDGPNLEELVREHGALEVGQACDFIRQAANGLQSAFEMGMVHRDVKPANLLVQRAAGGAGDTHCAVKILDFGLARLHANDRQFLPNSGTILTGEHTILGTPDFLSPEQARNLHDVDIRSDLYSLGCTLYYLLAGQVPFPGGSSMEKLVRHGTAQAVPVEQLRPQVPAAVGAIVRRLMAKDPALRFQTPAEVAAALAPFAVSGPPPWMAAPSSRAEEEGLLSPASDAPVLSNLPSSSPEAEEENVLVGTLSSDASATPLSTVKLTSPRLGRGWRAGPGWRLTTLLGVALAALGGVALLGWLLFR